MRKCPKCGKVYDNTWKVCLSCSVALVDDLTIPETNPEIRKETGVEEKHILWAKTKEQATIAIKYISMLLYLILAVKAFGVYMRGLIPLEIAEWLLILVLIFIVQKRKSRVASVLIALLVVSGQILQMVISASSGAFGTGIVNMTQIALIVGCISLTRATFVYNCKKG